ncbi:MAG TPA: hypothetical protein VK564_09140, partial [Thermodesulfobacteriota bacterium]|nr:hypothetical protein [Thermodesulfobacteriota bacterium]
MGKPKRPKSSPVLKIAVIIRGEHFDDLLKEMESLRLSRFRLELKAIALTSPSESCERYGREKKIAVLNHSLDLLSL